MVDKPEFFLLMVVAIVGTVVMVISYIQNEASLERLENATAQCNAIINQQNIRLAQCQACFFREKYSNITFPFGCENGT